MTGFTDTQESVGGNQQTSGGKGDAQTGKDGTNAEEPAADAHKNPENAKYAEQRRERERTAESERTRVRMDTVLAVTGGKNPFTGETIKDSTDAEEYLTMLKISQSGGDPLQDYAKTIKQQLRDAEQQAQQEEQRRQWYIDDRAAFKAAYPDVNLDELIRDPDFRTFSAGRTGKVPIGTIYHEYKQMVDRISAKAEQSLSTRLAQQQANRQATPGSLSGAGDGEAHFTREMVEKMSQEEVHENYDEIMQSMKYWK
jgi:hypothetical protein